MYLLTLKAILACKHQTGIVALAAKQNFVRISSSPVLVHGDPVGKPIAGCPNVGATIKPCTSTLNVTKGYSSYISINGNKVCLDTITGITDGTPPGVVEYNVKNPRQNFVSEV